MKAVILSLSRLTILLLSLVFAVLPRFSGAYEEIEEIVEVVEEAPQKRSVYFPQFQMFQTVKNEDQLIYDIRGRLEFVDECLRVVAGQQSYLLIWPGWYDFTVAGREIVVNKTASGVPVARLKIGDMVSFSGAELAYYPIMLQFGIPDSCLGPYWAVGDITSVKTEAPVRNFTEQAPKKIEKIFKPVQKPAVIKPLAKKPLKSVSKGETKKYKPVKRPKKELKKLEILLEDTMLR